MRRPLLIATLAAVVAGCGGATATAATPTFKNPHGTITVKAGTKFKISLDSNPGTGYAWKVTKAPDPKIARYLSTKTQSGSTMPGGSAQQVLTFSAKAKGTTSMVLAYVGPGRNAPVGKRLPLKLKVN